MVLATTMPIGINATVGLANTPVAPPTDMKAMITKIMAPRLAVLPPVVKDLKATSTAPLFCIMCTAEPVNSTMANSTAALWKPITTAFSTAKGP